MLISYGPRVRLNFVNVEDYRREAVFHDKNYLYTRITLTVTATFNPATQQDVLAGDNAPRFAGGSLVDGNGNQLPFVPVVPGAFPAPVGPLLPGPAGLPPLGSSPNANAGRPAAYTAEALKHDLLQPRQSLTFSANGVIVLQSPFPGMATDCTNGPTPLDCTVTKMTGAKLWKVRWVVQTDINESPLRTGSGNLHVVLSHRFSMAHDLNSQFFCTRTINGRVVFRSDVLLWKATFADTFRQYLFVPPPATGWARRAIRVKALDETTVDYQLVDEQLPVGWSTAGVSKVEAIHSVTLSRGEFETEVTEAALHVVESTASDIAGGAKEKNKTTATAIRAGTAMFRSGLKALPRMQHSIQVHAWGDPTSNRQNLAGFARGIIRARMNGVFQNIATAIGGWHIEVVHNPCDKEVVSTTRFSTGPIGTFFAILGGSTASKSFPSDDNSGTLLTIGSSPPVPGLPGNPADTSRGTYAEIAVAQALTGDAQFGNQAMFNPLPPPPPGNPPFTDF